MQETKSGVKQKQGEGQQWGESRAVAPKGTEISAPHLEHRWEYVTRAFKYLWIGWPYHLSGYIENERGYYNNYAATSDMSHSWPQANQDVWSPAFGLFSYPVFLNNLNILPHNQARILRLRKAVPNMNPRPKYSSFNKILN